MTPSALMPVTTAMESLHPPGCVGIVNVNVEPAPNSLFTQIFPPWSSMNFRQRVSPSPAIMFAGRYSDAI